MAKFVVNKQYDNKRTIEAKSFHESGSFVIFHSAAGEQVLALPVSVVHSIELQKEEG